MLRINKLTETEWKVAQLLDLGDLIGIDGEFGKTKTGEPTIQVTQLTFLTKSLEPHPKDVYGIGDEKLGKVDDVIFDHATGDVRYVVVDTSAT